AAVIRTIPNTPAAVGRGITAMASNPNVSPAQLALARTLLEAVGEVVTVQNEAMIDAVTAVSGSGPAYVFFFIEAMVRAGTRMGLSAEQSRMLAEQTFAGAAALSASSGEPAETLRARVTSKGGTTHAAITSMQADGVGEAFERALLAARARAQELGRGD
ncbi:MAG: pyrroline-5-carboxylate reductase family protein, partial [Rubrivivax sp.]